MMSIVTSLAVDVVDDVVGVDVVNTVVVIVVREGHEDANHE